MQSRGSIAYRASTYIYFIVVANLLFVFSSIPIVTLPMSLRGLFSVTKSFITERNTELVRPFFQAFRERALPSLAIGWVTLGIGAFLVFDASLVLKLHTSLQGVLVTAVALALFLYVTILFSIFPVLVSGAERMSKIIIQAALLSVYKPFLTLANWLAVALLALLSIRFPFLFAFCFFSLSAYLTSYIALRKMASLSDKKGHP